MKLRSNSGDLQVSCVKLLTYVSTGLVLGPSLESVRKKEEKTRSISINYKGPILLHDPTWGSEVYDN